MSVVEHHGSLANLILHSDLVHSIQSCLETTHLERDGAVPDRNSPDTLSLWVVALAKQIVHDFKKLK